MSGGLTLINFLSSEGTSLDLLRFVVLTNFFMSASWSFTCVFSGFTFLLDQIMGSSSSFRIGGKSKIKLFGGIFSPEASQNYKNIRNQHLGSQIRIGDMWNLRFSPV